jgi:hypothetical protein
MPRSTTPGRMTTRATIRIMISTHGIEPSRMSEFSISAAGA